MTQTQNPRLAGGGTDGDGDLTDSILSQSLTTVKAPKPRYRLVFELASNIPAELKALGRWVCWSYVWKSEAWAKVPTDPGSGLATNHLDPKNWLSFDRAVSYVKKHKTLAGIGIVFSDDDDLAGVDLDNCIGEAGTIAPWAIEIIKTLNSYGEISPSGRGVKLFCRGDFPHSGKLGDVEMYTTGRFFTVTGAWL